MPLRDIAVPVPMTRFAVVTATARLRETLVAIAATGCAQLEVSSSAGSDSRLEELRREESGDAASRRGAAALAAALPDVHVISGRNDLVEGELQLAQRAAAGVTHGAATILLGWTPEMAALERALLPCGASLVALPQPPWEQPPTMLPATPAGTTSFRPMLSAYGTVPYADVDPTLFAATAFVLMFGAMFADLGHGVLVAIAGLFLRRSRMPSLAWARPAWPMLVAGGASAALFGVLYGEAFGPTGLVPALWLEPLRSPLTLLAAGIALGGCLLLISALLGAVNRWREGGPYRFLLAPSGLSSVLLVCGLAVLVIGAVTGSRLTLGLGGVIGAAAVLLLFTGLLVETRRGLRGLPEAVVELFDLLLRAGANAISFARLAAFGLMHSAISLVVWQGTVANLGGWRSIAAVLIFVTGTAVALSLEALVAGVQALRLEYYELFSRIFATEGRPFEPWHLRVVDIKESAA